MSDLSDLDIDLMKSRAAAACMAQIKSTGQPFELTGRSTCGTQPYDWFSEIQNATIRSDPTNYYIMPIMNQGLANNPIEIVIDVPSQGSYYLFVQLTFSVNPANQLPTDPQPVVSFGYNTRKGTPNPVGYANEIPSGNPNESTWVFVVPPADGSTTKPNGDPISPQFYISPRGVGGLTNPDVIKSCAVLPFQY